MAHSPLSPRDGRADTLGRFSEGLNRLLGVLDDQLARDLTDRELLTLAAWGRHNPDADLVAGVQAVRAECERRAEQGRTFAPYLDEPTLAEQLRRLLADS